MVKKTTAATPNTKRDAAEAEIRAKQSEVKYDTLDLAVDHIVREFKNGLFFVPDYQRKFVWDVSRRCRFIESVILGLPVPMMFIARLDDGRFEIVDGVQRIKTLEEFTGDDLRLGELEKLPSLNGFCFSDLPESQQRKLKTRFLRVVVLDETTTEDTRQAIFDRINTSPLRAKGAEIRRGALAGPFAKFLSSCASNDLFTRLCPISPMLRARREDEELVLRFFAYSDRYKNFRHDVERFLSDYLKSHRDRFPRSRMAGEFDAMLNFVQKHFPHGFAKTRGAKSTPRVRFEAIAVGVNLALRESPTLSPPPVNSWIESEELEKHTTTHASNSGPRLRARVEFVRDKLLGK